MRPRIFSQWDRFIGITDYEIVARGDDDFEVCDVFVRNAEAKGPDGQAKWFRIGKAVAEGCDIPSALKLQRGLIFWTAVHMRRALVATGGVRAAAGLELGFAEAGMAGAEAAEAGPVDDQTARSIQVLDVSDKSVKAVPPSSVGFRPDFSPEGFAYKRRERVGGDKEKEKRQRQKDRDTFMPF